MTIERNGVKEKFVSFFNNMHVLNIKNFETL